MEKTTGSLVIKTSKNEVIKIGNDIYIIVINGTSKLVIQAPKTTNIKRVPIDNHLELQKKQTSTNIPR